ncbi:MAG: methionine adenosyltransferase domain-containing protein [Sphaerochaetaceae bacterium]|nr:methionine adenosyltransferase domain-containing protein [Sphaerochaetaceae bacterium]
MDEKLISERLLEHVDLRPAAIIERFDLRRPIYRKLAAYGHMGREDLRVPWEECDLVEELSELLK